MPVNGAGRLVTVVWWSTSFGGWMVWWPLANDSVMTGGVVSWVAYAPPARARIALHFMVELLAGTACVGERRYGEKGGSGDADGWARSAALLAAIAGYLGRAAQRAAHS